MRDIYPGVPLFARARNRKHEITLRSLGVHFVIRETVLSSLALTRQLFDTLGMDSNAIDAFEAHDKATLEKQAAVIDDPKAYRQTTMEASAELRTLFTGDPK